MRDNALTGNVYISYLTLSLFRSALIPKSYFPPNVSKFNAYAIHGKNIGEEKVAPEDIVYESLFPTSPGELPAASFHYLKPFGDIDLNEVCLV